MKRTAKCLIVVLLLFLFACSSKQLKPITLTEKLSPKLEQVNRLIIQSGSTGESREIDDKAVIDDWFSAVGDIVLYPQEDQEKRDGFLYAISLYHDEKNLFQLSLSYIDGVYYHVDDDMYVATEQLFQDSKPYSAK